MNAISLVIATKDRPADLRRLLASLRNQTEQPAEILIVDASQSPLDGIQNEFSPLNIRYLRHWPPSAAAQRNAGVSASSPASTLIGFADDDTVFEPRAFARMLAFWNNAEPDILGAAFNILNCPPQQQKRLKHGTFAERLGMYSPQFGKVSASGWHTIIGHTVESQFVEWVPTTAVLFRRVALTGELFDEFFKSYSYLEDLDLGYSVSRRGRLAVVADAEYHHFPSQAGRISPRIFGIFEVRNRLYFVRKHSLSIARCYVGLAIRLAMSLSGGLLHFNGQLLLRAFGNLQEFTRQLINRFPDESASTTR